MDNRASGRAIDPYERELLEMLSEYLAIALRNSRLYGEISDTKRSLEKLIDSAGDAIISVRPNDRIDGWNPAAERIFGLSGMQALGLPITDLLPAAEYFDAKRRLEEGAAMHAFETTAAPALAVTLSALHGRHGELEGLIAIVRDITTQREVEQQLQQSEKLTALGHLAGGIAHDFNNLLQAILGYAQLMRQKSQDVEFVDRSLKVVEAAALDGTETVRRIQTFARLRPEEEFVAVDVNKVVKDTIALTRPRWEEKVAHDSLPLELRLDLGTVEPIRGRPARLTELATRKERDDVTIMVKDTGIGMSEHVRKRVFEPFFSTKGEAGSGLGLSMAYSIARRHDGDLSVESEPGRGAAFTLRLPITGERTETGAPLSVPLVRRQARVLVVDDDPKVLSALCEMLKSAGHTVTPAPSGAAGLAAYAPGRFDMVLTNLGMAGMNGWQVAERLRAADRGVPILFITGWGLRQEDKSRLAVLGVRRCLYKPVQPGELDAAIQETLASP